MKEGGKGRRGWDERDRVHEMKVELLCASAYLCTLHLTGHHDREKVGRLLPGHPIVLSLKLISAWRKADPK